VAPKKLLAADRLVESTRKISAADGPDAHAKPAHYAGRTDNRDRIGNAESQVSGREVFHLRAHFARPESSAIS